MNMNPIIKRTSRYCWIAVFMLASSGAGFSAFAQDVAALQEETSFYMKKKLLPISGEQEGDYSGRGYVVLRDLVIPRGKKATFMPGATIYMGKDTRILVQGTLIASGAAEKPVHFRRLPNSDYFLPIDSLMETRWNGISIEDSGALECLHTIIEDSKNGVEALKAAWITLDTVQFTNNKFANLTVEGSALPIPKSGIVTLRIKPDAMRVSAQKPIVISSRVTLRIGTGALVLGGAGYSVYQYFNLKKLFETSQRTPTTDFPQKKVDDSYAAYKSGEPLYYLGMVVTGLAILGFGCTFYF